MPYPDLGSYVEMMAEAAVASADEAAPSRRSARGAAFQRDREQAAVSAIKEAQQHWEEWRTRASARIEAITSRSPQPPAPGLPGNPLAASPFSIGPLPIGPLPGTPLTDPASRPAPEKPLASFSLRTVSYASTSALARALAGSQNARFSAPDSPGRRTDSEKRRN